MRKGITTLKSAAGESAMCPFPLRQHLLRLMQILLFVVTMSGSVIVITSLLLILLRAPIHISHPFLDLLPYLSSVTFPIDGVLNITEERWEAGFS